MQRLMGAAFMLAVLTFLSESAFSAVVCHVDHEVAQREKVESIVIEGDQLVVNDSEVVDLSVSKIRCGAFGKQTRLDGHISKDLQLVLKSCTDHAVLEGHLINTATKRVAEISCF